jgi:predicted transposase YbfD/YdcC
MDMVVITICATICGANDWAAVAEYGRAKQEWLKTFLALPNGIPSHDIFNRLFARLKPEQLQSCFIDWMQAVHQVTEGELLNVDGKTLRSAIEPGNSRSLIHLLSIESDVTRLAEAVRHHWSIENQLHWVLDVSFQEDTIRGCQGYRAENLAVIRQIGLNLLSQDQTTKVGIKTKRLKAGWNDDYLKQVLTAPHVSTRSSL